MKQKVFFSLLFLLLALVHCRSECESQENPSSSSDCKGKNVSEGNKYCCYVHVKASNGEKIKCEEFTEEEYKLIPDMVKAGKKEADEYKIDCGAKYLAASLLATVLVLF